MEGPQGLEEFKTSTPTREKTQPRKSLVPRAGFRESEFWAWRLEAALPAGLEEDAHASSGAQGLGLAV